MYDRVVEKRRRQVEGMMPCWMCGERQEKGAWVTCWELIGYFESEVFWACEACSRVVEADRRAQMEELPRLSGWKSNEEWEAKINGDGRWRKGVGECAG
jgi:hypothetical protein